MTTMTTDHRESGLRDHIRRLPDEGAKRWGLRPWDSYREVIWDQMCLAKDIAAKCVREDDIGATYQISFQIVLDAEMRALLAELAESKHRNKDSAVRRYVKHGLNECLRGEDDPQQQAPQQN